MAVDGLRETVSASAISAVDAPAVMRSTTSHSRGVSGLLIGRIPEVGPADIRSRSIRRQAIEREIAASPVVTRSMARARAGSSVCLADIARSTLGKGCQPGIVVARSRQQDDRRSVGRRQHRVERGRPPLRGSPASMTITSGSQRPLRLITWDVSAACPTTAMPASWSASRSAFRASPSLSATRALIAGSLPFRCLRVTGCGSLLSYGRNLPDTRCAPCHQSAHAVGPGTRARAAFHDHPKTVTGPAQVAGFPRQQRLREPGRRICAASPVMLG